MKSFEKNVRKWRLISRGKKAGVLESAAACLQRSRESLKEDSAAEVEDDQNFIHPKYAHLFMNESFKKSRCAERFNHRKIKSRTARNCHHE